MAVKGAILYCSEPMYCSEGSHSGTLMYCSDVSHSGTLMYGSEGSHSGTLMYCSDVSHSGTLIIIIIITQTAAIALEPLTTHPDEWAEPSHK